MPAVVGADLAGELAGVPLTLSEYAAGESLEEALASAGDDDAAAIGDAVGRTLAAIGGFTFDAPGLLGPTLRPEPFEAPLPDLLVAFGERVLGEPEAREALGGFIADGFLTLLRESASSLEPVATQSSLVHSDFNGKNLVLARTFEGAPRVEAVLDWEFAFSGPPLADVGNMLRRQERMSGGVRRRLQRGVPRRGRSAAARAGARSPLPSTRWPCSTSSTGAPWANTAPMYTRGLHADRGSGDARRSSRRRPPL